MPLYHASCLPLAQYKHGGTPQYGDTFPSRVKARMLMHKHRLELFHRAISWSLAATTGLHLSLADTQRLDHYIPINCTLCICNYHCDRRICNHHCDRKVIKDGELDHMCCLIEDWAISLDVSDMVDSACCIPSMIMSCRISDSVCFPSNPEKTTSGILEHQKSHS